MPVNHVLRFAKTRLDDGQKLVGHFGIPPFGKGVVIVTALAQVGVTAPVVRDDQRPRSDRAIDKSAKGFGASVSGDASRTRARDKRKDGGYAGHPSRGAR